MALWGDFSEEDCRWEFDVHIGRVFWGRYVPDVVIIWGYIEFRRRHQWSSGDDNSKFSDPERLVQAQSSGLSDENCR